MKRRIIIAMALLSMSAACNKTLVQNEQHEESSQLKLDVHTGNTSKALITESTLEDGSEVGAFLLDTDGNLYDGFDYGNIRYEAQGTSGNQTWVPDAVVMLSASRGVLYTYYPYSAAVTSIRNIPLTADSETQTDYMYGTAVEELYNHSPNASVTLNHALSAISISLKRGTYSGNGTVTGISVKGNGISSSCIMDGTDGSLSSFNGTNNEISPSLSPFQISETGAVFNIIAVPNGQNAEIKIVIVIDGEEFTINTDAITLAQGSAATYNITVNNGSADITGMTVKEWGYTPAGNPTIQKDYAVTLTGDMEGISFDNKVNSDGSIQIIAVPYHSKDAEVNPVEISGNAVMAQETSESNGARIITLSEINSDISIIFHGYCLWITATYEISDISSPVQLNYDANGRTNNPVRMQIDGKENDICSSYEFQTTGTHVIRFAFDDKTEVAYSFFMDINTLSAIRIPEGVSTIAHNAFFGCRGLKSVTLPESLLTLEYECFRDAVSLESVKIPESTVNMGNAIFRGCSNLSDVNLPTGLTKIPNTMFRECTSLTSMKLHEGVTNIGSSAFIYSGIESIDLPSSLTYLDSDALSNCYYLSSITCRAATPPEKYAYSDIFTGIKSNGVLYVPSSSVELYEDSWLTGQLLNKKWSISTIE